MSKSPKNLEQTQLAFDWDKKVDEYVDLTTLMLCPPQKETTKHIDSYSEACFILARSMKVALKESGLSREQLVDGINDYFGFVEGEKNERTPMSIHMLNNHMAKPVEYPIDAVLFFAIIHCTKSLEPVRPFTEAEGAKIITGDEVRQLNLGKLEEHLTEVQKLKRELKKGF